MLISSLPYCITRCQTAQTEAKHVPWVLAHAMHYENRAQQKTSYSINNSTIILSYITTEGKNRHRKKQTSKNSYVQHVNTGPLSSR